MAVRKVKGKRIWRLKTRVIGFKALEGKHDGDNLGRYFVSIAVRAGIIDPERKISKVTRQPTVVCTR